MVTKIHSTPTAPDLSMPPSFLQWQADENGTLRLVREPALICPRCQEPCGHLYDANGTGEPLCLSCNIDDDLVARREAEEDERVWAEDCSTCGID